VRIGTHSVCDAAHTHPGERGLEIPSTPGFYGQRCVRHVHGPERRLLASLGVAEGALALALSLGLR